MTVYYYGWQQLLFIIFFAALIVNGAFNKREKLKEIIYIVISALFIPMLFLWQSIGARFLGNYNIVAFLWNAPGEINLLPMTFYVANSMLLVGGVLFGSRKEEKVKGLFIAVQIITCVAFALLFVLLSYWAECPRYVAQSAREARILLPRFITGPWQAISLSAILYLIPQQLRTQRARTVLYAVSGTLVLVWLAFAFGWIERMSVIGSYPLRMLLYALTPASAMGVWLCKDKQLSIRGVKLWIPCLIISVLLSIALLVITALDCNFLFRLYET